MNNATTRNKKRIAALLAECECLAENKSMKNARRALAMLKRRRLADKPFKAEYWEKTQAACDKAFIQNLELFIAACNAPQIDFISVHVEWKRSATWGWCPRSYVRTAAGEFNYYSSGYGYDKLSHSIFYALQGAAWTRFAIENWNKIKECYGFDAKYWLPSFDFAGCWISTLENMLRAAGWKHCGHECRTYDRQGSTIAANYSKH